MSINTTTLGDVDHEKVATPYLKLTSIKEQVFTYDMRFSQPNVAYLSTDVLHSIEHLLNVEFTDLVGDKHLVAAPFGCGTGMWVLSHLAPEEFHRMVVDGLYNIVNNYDEVPLCSAKTCGNFRNHSLIGAKSVLNNYLMHQDNWDKVYVD